MFLSILTLFWKFLWGGTFGGGGGGTVRCGGGGGGAHAGGFNGALIGGGGGLVLGCLIGRNVRDFHWAFCGELEFLKILSCDWWKAGNWFLLLIAMLLNWGAV